VPNEAARARDQPAGRPVPEGEGEGGAGLSNGFVGGNSSVASVDGAAAGASIGVSWPAIARMTFALSSAGGAFNGRAYGSIAAVL